MRLEGGIAGQIVIIIDRFIKVIFITCLILIFTPSRWLPSPVMTQGALSTLVSLLFVFSASYLLLAAITQVYWFFKVRQTRKEISSEFNIDELMEKETEPEPERKRKDKLEEYDYMDA